MFNSILPRPGYFDHYCFSGNGDPGDGGGSGGTGTPPAPPAQPPAPPAGITQDKVDEIVKGRVAETKKATEEAIAKQLGVTVEEAKKIVEAHTERTEAEKSEAQRARDAADAEKVEAERVKGESAQEKHNAKVERAILRAVQFDPEMSDEDVDKKVGRIARLVEVEVGSDLDAIKAAVKALKDDEPLMFGTAEPQNGGGRRTPQPSGDPKGTPPKATGTEGAYDRGAQRAKQANGTAEYPILAGSQPNNV